MLKFYNLFFNLIFMIYFVKCLRMGNLLKLIIIDFIDMLDGVKEERLSWAFWGILILGFLRTIRLTFKILIFRLLV